jgi:hypothetical protein
MRIKENFEIELTLSMPVSLTVFLKPSPVLINNGFIYFVAGIMTLTRAPCDLDTMSLFQDLKLKRRKVDSRCSSDGKF